MENMTKIKDEAYTAAKEILEKAKLEKGDLFVVGCSTSEVWRNDRNPFETGTCGYGICRNLSGNTGVRRVSGSTMLRTLKPCTDP